MATDLRSGDVCVQIGHCSLQMVWLPEFGGRIRTQSNLNLSLSLYESFFSNILGSSQSFTAKSSVGLTGGMD
jgi:hypothetical protein